MKIQIIKNPNCNSFGEKEYAFHFVPETNSDHDLVLYLSSEPSLQGLVYIYENNLEGKQIDWKEYLHLQRGSRLLVSDITPKEQIYDCEWWDKIANSVFHAIGFDLAPYKRELTNQEIEVKLLIDFVYFRVDKERDEFVAYVLTGYRKNKIDNLLNDIQDNKTSKG